MTSDEFYNIVKQAKKKMKKLGSKPTKVRISYELYKELTGRGDIPCGKIDGMDIIVDFEINDMIVCWDEGGTNG